MRKSKKAFTLLELFICIALLGTLSTVLFVQIKDFLARNQFENSVNGFHSRLQQFKIVAMSYESDIELIIYKDKEELFYKFQVNQPLAIPDAGKAFVLKGVAEVSVGDKKEAPYMFTIFSSSRIEPSAQIHFLDVLPLPK